MWSFLKLEGIGLYEDYDAPEKKMKNPLDWWEKIKKSYPLLCQVAYIVLAIPATSAPVERLFSAAGIVLNKARNRLDPDLAAEVIFLKESWEGLKELCNGKDVSLDFERHIEKLSENCIE